MQNDSIYFENETITVMKKELENLNYQINIIVNINIDKKNIVLGGQYLCNYQ